MRQQFARGAALLAVVLAVPPAQAVIVGEPDTAAHCVEDASLQYSVSVSPGPPFAGTLVAASYVATAPGWTGAYSFPDTRDLGVIVLSEAIYLPRYGLLPPPRAMS